MRIRSSVFLSRGKASAATGNSFIISMESVFAALCGGIFLHEVMTGREILGCVIMFSAFLLSQLAETKKPLENHEKRDLA